MQGFTFTMDAFIFSYHVNTTNTLKGNFIIE